jgi:hypothetical protein
MKNTYGPVQLWTPSGVRATGQQFLGTLFGDHAKTGIGTMLTTGTVIGAGANVFGSNVPPKVVPPFAWGDGEPYETYDIAKFLSVAERMMLRRDVELGEQTRLQLTEAHKRRWRMQLWVLEWKQWKCNSRQTSVRAYGGRGFSPTAPRLPVSRRSPVNRRHPRAQRPRQRRGGNGS